MLAPFEATFAGDTALKDLQVPSISLQLKAFTAAGFNVHAYTGANAISFEIRTCMQRVRKAQAGKEGALSTHYRLQTFDRDQI
jgi:hypothetical protein